MPSPSAPHSAPPSDARRWAVLTVVAIGFVLMTLNWFNIAPAFGPVSEEFHMEIAEVALLISAFVAGYGIFHIPAGFLATRLGLRATLVTGLVLEGAAAALSGAAGGYGPLLALRIVCGIGASIYAGIGIAAVSVWFTGRRHAFALGVVSATFSLGAALGLYVWADVVEALGWREALVLSGTLCVLAGVAVGVVFRVPPGGESLAGVSLTRQAIRETLGNRLLWVYGVAFLGGYGAYFAASQLLETYGEEGRGFGAGTAGLAALVIGLAGIPGSVVAGWLSDRFGRRRPVIVAMTVLQAAGLLLVPVAGEAWFWVPAFVIGFAFNGSFAVWQTVPGEDRSVSPENIGTAVGLMLTITAVGGFVLPWAFGLIVPAAGYGAAWVFLGAATLLFALAGGAAREPEQRAGSAASQESPQAVGAA
ncbi:Predicted arabinose efflux permease, MFS family [Thermomonospora echinospora]|uniref:Predicted arabinose efflux permease, MFS family n=1 Tax=Thermomonospora echinospora TaxID=1992 RepID=A0A1H6E2V7_9ACTN|nr:MFS transporter [Thermomonospora echinospora]SEG91962.1 Predicted arabinose efflux permease, MFS family [Thermomonospora echinospora]